MGTDLKFVAIADVQYADAETKWGRDFRGTKSKLEDALALVNHRLSVGERFDFSIQLGDLIDRDLESFDTILPVWQGFPGPRYSLIGNHDYGIQDTQALAQILQMPSPYYQFTMKGWRVIVLDTNEISTYAWPDGHPMVAHAYKVMAALRERGKPNGSPWNGGVTQTQLDWLRDVLVDAKAANQRALVFGHHPVFDDHTHNSLTDDEIEKVLIEAGNVAAYICGHSHKGRIGTFDGVHLINLKGMVEGEAPQTAWSIFTVSDSAIRIEGFGEEEDLELAL